jgi:hypothetical protein
MRLKPAIITLIISLTPFIIGLALYVTLGNIHTPLTTESQAAKKNLNYKGININWDFYPDWEYKPLFVPAEEYLVFMFHYINNNDYNIQVMPSYTLASPNNRRYLANEEISIYIEDSLENKIKAEDQTPISFEISPNDTKHYIATFEKPRSLKKFYVDVDIFRDVTLRIYYEKENDFWKNYKNEFIKKYKGRG